ncbi:hypothetical protein [Micromonospora sp. RP3T]|uniref:hypothetical protein n=1 Tax=Micromonospora sp. RP3T TaxID=2135446 RepID=UPI003D75F6DB
MPLDEQASDPAPEQVADAQAAYAAYGAETGNRNFRGEPMPEWGGLGDTIQRAWIAAAAAVRASAEREALRQCVSRTDRDGQPTAGRLYGAIGEHHREALCEWLNANGVDPGEVPVGAGFEIHDGQLTVEVVVQKDGCAVVADRGFDGVLRTTRVVPLQAPFPDLGYPTQSARTEQNPRRPQQPKE